MKRLLMMTGGVVVACALAFSGAVSATAKPWENVKQKITFVVPFGAGGSTNATARIMAQKLVEFGLDVVVVNKPGADGTQGTHWCAQQPPTSGVMCVMSPSSFLYNPAIENTGYDWKNFDPVATWGGAAFAFAVKPDSKYQTIKQVIDDAIANPNRVTIGSTGTGDQAFIIEEMMEQAKAKHTYVAYKGGGDVTTSLLGGHIDVGYISVAGLAALVKDGKLRMIAHTSPFGKRLSAFPSVEHISDYGYNQQAVSFYSLWGPKGMPVELREAVAAAVEVASKDPWVVAENDKLGLTVEFRGVKDTESYIKDVVRDVVPPFAAWMKKNAKR